jgi:imidazolonepropionase-like amidohydrolase
MQLAITNGRIIDGTGRPPRKGTVVIGDGRISSVELETGPEPAVDQIIDAEGSTVLPGLIDAHDHQTYHNTFGPLPQQWRLSRDQLVVRSCIAACDALRHGVTSIREMGAPGATNLSMRRVIDRGEMVGPRMVTCGLPLSIWGGHAYEICVEICGIDGVREAVQQQLKNGADFIKLMASNEQPMPNQLEQTVPQFTLEELRAAVNESHDAGVKIAVHVCGSKAIERCLDAGVDAVEHAIYLNLDLAQRMKEQRVYYTPTLGIYRANTDPRWQRGGAKAAFCQLLVAAHRQSFEYALQAGLLCTIGTDAIVPMSVEMKHLVDAGVDPMDVLCGATRTNAELIGFGKELGTLEVGKLADILIVDGDPLIDMNQLANVRTILRGGVVYLPEQLLPMLPVSQPLSPEDNLR